MDILGFNIWTWYTIAVILMSAIYAVVFTDPNTFYESIPGYAMYDLGRKAYTQLTAAKNSLNPSR